MTTTPKTLKEGGRNWGEVQLSTPVTFPSLVLKRGITRDTELWQWYRFIYQTGVYAYRADCTIEVKESAKDENGEDRIRMRWIARNWEESQWNLIPRNNTGVLKNIGELHGIENLPKNRRIELLPHVLGQLDSAAFTAEDQRERTLGDGSAGLDAKVGLSSNFTLDATVVNRTAVLQWCAYLIPLLGLSVDLARAASDHAREHDLVYKVSG